MDYCEAFTSYTAAQALTEELNIHHCILINARAIAWALFIFCHMVICSTCIYIFTLINYVRNKCFVGEVSEHCMYMHVSCSMRRKLASSDIQTDI